MLFFTAPLNWLVFRKGSLLRHNLQYSRPALRCLRPPRRAQLFTTLIITRLLRHSTLPSNDVCHSALMDGNHGRTHPRHAVEEDEEHVWCWVIDCGGQNGNLFRRNKKRIRRNGMEMRWGLLRHCSLRTLSYDSEPTTNNMRVI